MANPVLTRLANTPVQATGRSVTIDDILIKTLAQFAVLIPIAGATFLFTPPHLLSGVVTMSIFASIVFAAVSFFKKRVGPALAFTYAVMEGVLLGSITALFELLYPGVAVQAVVATVVAATVVIAGTKAGLLRTSPRLSRMFAFAVMGYMAFAVIAFAASLLGFPILTLGTPLALAVSVFGITLAVYSLVMDVEVVGDAVRNGAPESEAWRLSFGLVTSLAWLYFEILRLAANLRAMAD